MNPESPPDAKRPAADPDAANGVGPARTKYSGAPPAAATESGSALNLSGEHHHIAIAQLGQLTIARMPTYQADAIVLRRLDYGEADRILTILSREQGKFAAIAKGARKSKTRSQSALDLFSRSQMMIAKGKNLDVVAQVQRIGDARHIAGDVQRTAYASLLAEVVDKVVEDRHPVEDIFELVVTTLARLNSPDRSARADAAWFLMRVLDLLGYQPQLFSCPSCNQALSEAGGWFSPLLGGILCAQCGAHGQSGSSVSVRGLKVLRVMGADDAELYDRLKLSPELLAEIEQVLEAQLEYHLDRHLKSLDFIRTIR